MQRVGRINRVGTAFDRIYVFNFFPTAQASKQLPLTDRILEKLQAFHDTLGEDYKFLSEEENPTPQKLFHDLSQNMDEEQEASPELQYLAIIREVRDDNPQMFNKIKRLPKKSKTGRNSTAIHEDSTLTFIRKGALKSFYISDNLNTIALSFMDAIHYLECDSDEKKVAVGSAYYNHYQSNSHSFDETLTAEKVITRKKVTVRGNDATVVKALKAILDSGQLTDDQEDIAKCIIQAIENGDIPKNATKEIVKQIKAATNVISAFAIIRENIDDTYLYDRKDVVLPDEGKKEVILSCYMKKQE